ncbi:MAG TPA: hypothetical protein VG714_00120 [Acidobacteriaceae bacterium]|nr:hypothetical protein [Acidobacteriaceae bacterium]
MAELVQPGQQVHGGGRHSAKPAAVVVWLQVITLVWMLAELSVAVYAAITAHSPALLAFGSDSLVELLSAALVLLPGISTVSERRVDRSAGVLLFVLAGVVTTVGVLSFVLGWQPRVSHAGMAITVAALIVMPVLAALKRREARRTGNTALAADSIQSATCAWLALVTLIGLGLNAAFHIAWFDLAAALVAVPLLLREGLFAWHGHVCHCC